MRKRGFSFLVIRDLEWLYDPPYGADSPRWLPANGVANDEDTNRDERFVVVGEQVSEAETASALAHEILHADQGLKASDENHAERAPFSTLASAMTKLSTGAELSDEEVAVLEKLFGPRR